MASTKPISKLPLPPTSHILTHQLTPDSFFPSPKAWFEKIKANPTMQRRARLMNSSAHFSYVSPLPIPFPYRIIAPDPPQEGDDKGAYVERWLAAQEPLEPIETASPATDPSALGKWTSSLRNGRRELLGVSPAGLRDCLPALDVGDTFEVVGTPSLSDCRNPIIAATENAARQELVDVLSGQTALLSAPPNEPESNTSGYAPWSLRYSGHQFGNWAGQLGDGRAISIREPRGRRHDVS
jgi:serine/tyrosine/threonine adenylyltransferase